ncbi:MAG: hypothetical protein IJH37_09335 [Clostridia bacterium]|nr:hypothetical protein [Clostridia bacterium]
MKRVLFALFATIVITVVIPLVIVEFVPPMHNAASTAPRPAATMGADT